MILVKFDWANRLFFVSKRVSEGFAKKKMSNLLFCSFIISNLSELLTVALSIWAIWGNEGMSDVRNPNPEKNTLIDHY